MKKKTETRSVYKKILVFIYGIIFVAIFFEITLTITSFFNNYDTDDTDDKEKRNSKEFVILCLGNSHTKGVSLKDTETFPGHLNTILNKFKLTDRDIRVINGGMHEINSAGILEKLPSFLTKYSPDLVILRTGGPNWRNGYHYSSYLDRIGQSNVENYLYDALYRVRTLRFFRYLYANLRNIIKHNFFKKIEDQIELCHSDKECSYLSQWFIYSLTNISGPLLKKRKHFLNEKLKRINWFIEKYPLVGDLYYVAGLVYIYEMKDIKKALSFLGESIKLTSCNIPLLHNQSCGEMLFLMNSPSLSFMAKEVLNTFLAELKVIDIDSYNYLMRYSDTSIINWINSDYDQIIKILSERRISILLHNYPPYPDVQSRKKINDTIQAVAKRHNLPFVDLHQKLTSLFKKGEDENLYYIQYGGQIDEHLSSLGNSVSAKMLADKILTLQGLIK